MISNRLISSGMIFHSVNNLRHLSAVQRKIKNVDLRFVSQGPQKEEQNNSGTLEAIKSIFSNRKLEFAVGSGWLFSPWIGCTGGDRLSLNAPT